MLVLSQYVEPVYTAELLESGEGGIGYLLKERVGEVRGFVDAVSASPRGGTALDREVSPSSCVTHGRMRAIRRSTALTPREREVLGLMAEGRTNAAIARALVVTAGAVEKHVSSIFGKLDLPSTDDDHRRVLAVLTYLRAAWGAGGGTDGGAVAHAAEGGPTLRDLASRSRRGGCDRRRAR